MTYIYLAHAPEDRAFVERLSKDLWVANLEHWFDAGGADEATSYRELQRATHVVAILSPAAQLHEAFLGALEFAKQQKLTRLALRVKPLDGLPPQLQGVLPIDFTDPAAYEEQLETLLEDFQVEAVPPKPQLPQALLDELYSDEIETRRRALEKLLDYRKQDEVMKNLAQEEVNALAFRERDSTLKNLARTAVQLFDKEEREPEPEVHLPSKEDLKLQSGEHAVLVEHLPPLRIPAPTKRYLWQSSRWFLLLGGLALLVGGLLFALTSEVVVWVPMVVMGVVLPYFNVWIRKGGAFEWRKPAPLVWNTILGGLIGVGLALIFTVGMAELNQAVLPLCGVAGVLYGLLVGWLSTIEGA